MVIALLPLLIAIVGLLMYFVSANGKVQEAGRIMFFCGLLVTLEVLARTTVRLG